MKLTKTTKDIFGDPIQQSSVKKMSYAEKLKEAKAKAKYKQYQAQQRKQQMDNFKKAAGRSKLGLQKLGGLIKKSSAKKSIYKKE